MSELLSIVVPLETLAGWPTAPNPSVLTSLGLLVGFPLLVFVVVYGIGYLSSLARRGRGETEEVSDSAWVGSAPAAVAQGSDTRAALESAPSATGPTGGAGARW